MLLDPYNQTDHPQCKSRPDSGLSAITELDPGYITGIFTSPSLFCVNCQMYLCKIDGLTAYFLFDLQVLFLQYGKNGSSGVLNLV